MSEQALRKSLERAVRAQLQFCSEALDILGMDVAGAYLDAAIQSFNRDLAEQASTDGARSESGK